MSASRLAIVLLASASLAGVGAAADVAKPHYGSWGVDETSMDRTVKPGNDFFGYAEGNWLKTVSITADKSRAGYNYDLPDEAERDVRVIVDRASRDPRSPMERQIADFYAAWMDGAGIEAREMAPLHPYLAKIDAVGSRHDLVRLMAEPGYASPVGIGIQPDEKDPTHYTVGVAQADLGLPTRDYYLLKGAKYEEIRKAYRDYIVRIGTLAGMPDPDGRADRILALETQLAQDQWTPEQLRDPVKTYNPMTRAQLTALAPEFDWTPVLAGIGLGAMPIVDVGTPSAVTAAGKRIADVPIATWKEYLAFRFISDHAIYLPKAFDDAHFGFYSHTLNDVPV
jgi:putative endopeptidase